MERRARDVWLDALRGSAVLLVLGRHLEVPADANALLTIWQRGGWVGVDLFFVLSGFLISGLLFREYQRQGSLTLPRFLIRRGFRIYPAFAVLLLCTWLVARAVHVPHVSGKAFLAEALFVQNYCGGIWNHTWSLAVEEHFYIALPLMLLFLLRCNRRTSDPFRALIPLGVTAMIALLGLRCVNAWWRPYSNPTHLFPTHLRADSLLAGVLLAYAYHMHRAGFERCIAGRRPLLLCAGVACFVPAFCFDLAATAFISTFGLTLFALGAVLLIAAGVGSDAPAIARWLAPIGGCSYSIYLWHMPVLIWVLPLGEHVLGYRLDVPARVTMYLSGSLAAGALMAWLIERPALWLRDRCIPPPGPVTSMASAYGDGALKRCA
jgi:peptidoglycan/LPS O-acetylase OafA/YrhL